MGGAPEENTVDNSALRVLQSPDGYYTYLGIKQLLSTADGDLDQDQVQKHYRRLSLRHHPDRKDGDAETFRMLNRAKKVLTTKRLRKQYDLIGLDLMDEENEEDKSSNNSSDDKAQKKENSEHGDNASPPHSVISHLASATLGSILQVLIRTVMLCLLSTFLCRFKLTVFLVVVALSFITYKMRVAPLDSPQNLYLQPLGIAASTFIMHLGITMNNYFFNFGEWIAMTLFIFSSLPPASTFSKPVTTRNLVIICSIPSFILAIIMKGRFYRYVVLIIMEAIVAILAVLAFPVMEMIIEEIIKEKMVRVGEKIRAWHKVQNGFIEDKEKKRANGPTIIS